MLRNPPFRSRGRHVDEFWKDNMSLALCVFLFAPPGQAATAQDEAAASKASLERIVADLADFGISTAVKPAQKLTLSGEPVLRWNYPSRNLDDAALFVWLGKDRPEVVTTVMSYHDGAGNPRRAYEFLSISQEPLDALQNGNRVWYPEKPGFTWKTLPGAPAPARTLPERRRQMRDLAARFQAAVSSDKNRYELRVLSQPLYRYQNAKADILDGCLFAFVEGTDPELILALESPAGDPGWKFATGRLTRYKIEVQFDNQVVREFPEMTGAGELSDVYRIPDAGPLDPVDKTKKKSGGKP
jgi:hypothetical protein